MNQSFKLEVIGFSIEGCINAQKAGAHRIELCDNPADGGTTPSYGFIKAARNISAIELYIMIRPRGGDFIYTREELDIMQHDIAICKELGCDGIVLGLLDHKGNVDVNNTYKLVEAAYPMGVTFHRAFDRVKDPLRSLEDVRQAGCERVLTSGLHSTVLEGITVLQQLIEHAGDLIIMPGAGVRSENILTIASNLNTTEFHTSARTTRPSAQAPSLIKEQMDPITTDGNEIKKMVNILKKYYK